MQVGELEEHGAFSGRLCRFVVLAVAGSAGVLRLSQFQSSVSSSLTMIT